MYAVKSLSLIKVFLLLSTLTLSNFFKLKKILFFIFFFLLKINIFFGLRLFKILSILDDLSSLSKNEYDTPVFQQATMSENAIIFLSDSIAIISFFLI